MPAYGNWKEDLQLGRFFEDVAVTMLGAGEVERAPDRQFSDWDFRHNGRAYESKSDRLTVRTGNLCIEYEHTGVPSGISLTKADEWFYFAITKSANGTPTSWDCYRIPVEVLKKAIAVPGVRKWYTDGGNSQFYLLPARDFEKYLVFSPPTLQTPQPSAGVSREKPSVSFGGCSIIPSDASSDAESRGADPSSVPALPQSVRS